MGRLPLRTPGPGGGWCLLLDELRECRGAAIDRGVGPAPLGCRDENRRQTARRSEARKVERSLRDRFAADGREADGAEESIRLLDGMKVPDAESMEAAHQEGGDRPSMTAAALVHRDGESTQHADAAVMVGNGRSDHVVLFPERDTESMRRLADVVRIEAELSEQSQKVSVVRRKCLSAGICSTSWWRRYGRGLGRRHDDLVIRLESESYVREPLGLLGNDGLDQDVDNLIPPAPEVREPFLPFVFVHAGIDCSGSKTSPEVLLEDIDASCRCENLCGSEETPLTVHSVQDGARGQRLSR